MTDGWKIYHPKPPHSLPLVGTVVAQLFENGAVIGELVLTQVDNRGETWTAYLHDVEIPDHTSQPGWNRCLRYCMNLVDKKREAA